MCVCVCVSLFPWPQFRADLHKIWHMASLYPPDGHGVSERCSSTHAHAPRVVCTPLQISSQSRTSDYSLYSQQSLLTVVFFICLRLSMADSVMEDRTAMHALLFVWGPGSCLVRSLIVEDYQPLDFPLQTGNNVGYISYR